MSKKTGSGVRTLLELAHRLTQTTPFLTYTIKAINPMTMNTATLSTIEINGVTYAPVGTSNGANNLPSGNRNVVVIDRGFIYAGDLSFDEVTQDYTLANAVWVFRWDSIGLDGVIRDPKSNKVTLKKMDNVVIVPRGSVIFRIPVSTNWGL